ncbi:MAG: hypothetical protein P8K09_05570 [Hyphomicrobiales bacterium]|nr:hypothetical protein [Hyphomicrobiales bacterium]|tara:strand:+ start:34 stop:366 length:333 start_codon:yes stop_codon:yes gene_type:complete
MEEIENTEQNIKSTRVLKLAILIMTLLLIIGFCIVFLTIGFRLSNGSTNQDPIIPLNNKITIEANQEILFINDGGKNILITLSDEKGNYTILNIDKRTNNIKSTIDLDKK